MKKTVGICISLIFILTMLLSVGFVCPGHIQSNAYHGRTFTNESEPELPSICDKKVFSTTTIDDDFAPDTINVILTRQVSRNLKTYTTLDFPEVRLT